MINPNQSAPLGSILFRLPELEQSEEQNWNETINKIKSIKATVLDRLGYLPNVRPQEKRIEGLQEYALLLGKEEKKQFRDKYNLLVKNGEVEPFPNHAASNIPAAVKAFLGFNPTQKKQEERNAYAWAAYQLDKNRKLASAAYRRALPENKAKRAAYDALRRAQKKQKES